MTVSSNGISSIDGVLHSIACRAAVKAGDKSSAYDVKQLAERVINDSALQYCPHGRPTSVTITKHELEKKFKRVL
jgi:DNA mismatch repair protein MutL